MLLEESVKILLSNLLHKLIQECCRPGCCLSKFLGCRCPNRKLERCPLFASQVTAHLCHKMTLSCCRNRLEEMEIWTSPIRFCFLVEWFLECCHSWKDWLWCRLYHSLLRVDSYLGCIWISPTCSSYQDRIWKGIRIMLELKRPFLQQFPEW